ncbi:hypothetical protein CPB86DRAFT_830363 [Serendipita vermifera]|nr:hypothetical protein CPB86DRAFT_830363 [Serendipita vermifera]
MIYHPLLRNLVLSIVATTILFVSTPTLFRDLRIVGTIVITNVAGLLLQKRVKSSVSSRTSDSKGNQLGFKVLSPGENPVVDIVVIHGLGGHRERSWTAANGKMWLQDFLPDDIPNARILTYGHDADTHSHTYMPTQRLLHFAEGFVEDLIRARRSDAESWGHNTEEDRLKVSTYGILFFGTPHSGANGVDLARLVGKLLSVYMVTDDSMIEDLNHNSVQLENIQTFYLDASKRIKSIFFYETDPTPMVTGIAELIVPRQSASIEGDLKEAPAEVERSWSEEKHHRNIDNGEVQPPSHPVLPKPRLPVSRNYVQRANIENFLTEKLLPSSSPKVQPRCVLYGLGGSGKTQVASFWIEANKPKFTYIIFIDASSQKQIEADLERAIRSVGPEWAGSTWEDAVSYLSKEKGWLLFFDNADAPDLRLEDYLPNSTHGAVLITTRNQEATNYSPDSHIRVGEMSQTEAVDLLHKVANIHPPSHDPSIAIVKELGMLALAVTQAGAYIFKTGQLDRYLSIFQNHRAELMQGLLKGRNYEGSTYTAFDLSFRLLPRNSQEFMKICAFLHHSHIPRALFEKSITNQFRYGSDIEGYPAMPEMEAQISSLKSIFGSEWDEFVFQGLIDPILQGSLMDGSPDRHGRILYDVHPLVQTYIQDLVIPTDQDRYALSAGQLLVGGIRRSKYDNKWDWELLPHVDKLPMRVKKAHISYAWTFADVYESTGRWNASVVLWRYCNIQGIKELGLHDSRVLLMRGNLGAALSECGEWKEAEEIQREVLELRKEILGPRHPDTILAMDDLASTLDDRGQLEEAERMRREVLELQKEILGPLHPNIIQTMYSLVYTLHERGQLEEARKMAQEGLELHKEIQGPRHPIATIVVHILTSAFDGCGQPEKVEKMMREAPEVSKEILGPQHPDRILAMYGLMSKLSDRGQL